MSIEVNGVTLPDIPSDVLEQYPYAIIVECSALAGSDEDYFVMYATQVPFTVSPMAVNGEGDVLIANNLISYLDGECFAGGTEWSNQSENGPGSVQIPLIVADTEYCTIDWSNHDIYEFDADGNVTDTIYFPSSVSHPSEYSIPHDDVVFLADQTRRLTGATGSMGFQEIKDGLESVVIGGGGGGSGDGVSVTFVSEGATVGSSFVLTGQKITSPGMESTDTHVFAGWYTAADGGGEKISFPYAPTEEITLYAYWVERYVIGVTGLNGSSGVLTYTGTVPDGIALETAASSGYVSVSSPLDNVWPFNAIEEFTDESGNVFIKFPKFWMRWVYDSDGGLDGYEISNTQAESDFFIPDAFLEPDCFGASEHRYLDYFALGKYEASGSSSMMYSKTGATCLVSITRANARAAARAYGDSSNYYNGYQQLDLAQLTAYNLLAMFYLGTTNVQSVYGGRTGSGQNTWSAASVTGTTDGVTKLTGWNMNTDCVKILGVENPFGNVLKWVDGVYFSGSTIYVHKFPQHYAESTTNGKAMGFSRPTSSAYISKLNHGTASDTPLSDVRSFLYASAVAGSESTYFGDYCYYNSSGVVLYSGGVWDNGAKAGLWYLYGNPSASGAYSYVGARLSYRPL